MTADELFLESLSSGVITQAEIIWLLSQQNRLTGLSRRQCSGWAACSIRGRSSWAAGSQRWDGGANQPWPEPPEAKRLNWAVLRQA